MKVEVAERGLVEAVPLVVFVPLQPPVAVQLVASVELHVRVAMPPTAMLVGLADNVTVGAGTTVTVAVWTALPPVPVHLSVNEADAVKAPVETDPLVAWAPLQPPEAAQPAASVELQVSIAEPPLATLVGLALSATVGALALEDRWSPAWHAQRLAPTTRALATALLWKAGETGNAGFIWPPSDGKGLNLWSARDSSSATASRVRSRACSAPPWRFARCCVRSTGTQSNPGGWIGRGLIAA